MFRRDQCDSFNGSEWEDMLPHRVDIKRASNTRNFYAERSIDYETKDVPAWVDPDVTVARSIQTREKVLGVQVIVLLNDLSPDDIVVINGDDRIIRSLAHHDYEPGMEHTVLVVE